MGPDQASELVRSLLMQALLLSAPLLILGCAVSVLLTLLQTLTGIQEQTITAVPRLLIVFVVCVVSAPWFVRHAVTYTLRLWMDFHRYLG
jgi:flagellar biosynthetic protein FliQ